MSRMNEKKTHTHTLSGNLKYRTTTYITTKKAQTRTRERPPPDLPITRKCHKDMMRRGKHRCRTCRCSNIMALKCAPQVERSFILGPNIAVKEPTIKVILIIRQMFFSKNKLLFLDLIFLQKADAIFLPYLYAVQCLSL